MTDYEEVRQKIKEKHLQLPLIGEHKNGEVFFLNIGHDENGLYYYMRTSQHNGWERINVFYKDGTSEEFYEK